MPRLPNRSSRKSRASSPRLAFEVPPADAGAARRCSVSSAAILMAGGLAGVPAVLLSLGLGWGAGPVALARGGSVALSNGEPTGLVDRTDGE